MAEIVQFPTAGSAKHVRKVLGNETSWRAHVTNIRSALEKAPRMKEADRLRTAENLWSILTKAEESGISKARTLQDAGKGGAGDSTKRLPHYAIDPTLLNDEKCRRAKELVQDGRKYLMIAESAGKLACNGDKDHFVAALFAGTSIGLSTDSVEDVNNADVYTELANMIREVSRGIARKHDLMRVFRDIEEHRLCRDPRHGTLWSSRDDWAALWGSFADGVRVSGIDDLATAISSPEPRFRNDCWLLPYPNLRIGWGDPAASGLAPGTNTWENPQFMVSRWIAAADGAKRLDALRREDGKPFRAPAKLFAEVRLGLLPVGAGGSPEPVFITRLWTLIHLTNPRLRELCVPDDPNDELPEFVSWPWLPSDWMAMDDHYLYTWGLDLGAPADLEQHEARCAALIGKEPALVMQFSPAGWDDQGGGLRIDLVSAASCRTVLELIDGREGALACEDGTFVRHLVDPKEATPEDRDDYICRSVDYTLASAVERSLFLARPDCRLDTLLDKECERVAVDVAAFLEPFKAARRRTQDEILQKWQDTGPK